MILRNDSQYDAVEDLEAFWCERLKGSKHTAWGQQARQILLSDIVYRETLGLRLDDSSALSGNSHEE